jgi:hypothetical protein
MEKSWVFDSIFGEPPVGSPSVPKLPIVDDPPPLSANAGCEVTLDIARLKPYHGRLWHHRASMALARHSI